MTAKSRFRSKIVTLIEHLELQLQTNYTLHQIALGNWRESRKGSFSGEILLTYFREGVSPHYRLMTSVKISSCHLSSINWPKLAFKGLGHGFVLLDSNWSLKTLQLELILKVCCQGRPEGLVHISLGRFHFPIQYSLLS